MPSIKAELQKETLDQKPGSFPASGLFYLHELVRRLSLWYIWKRHGRFISALAESHKADYLPNEAAGTNS